ncbi:MAG: hypothetical protein BWY19_00148 [bacterium ADurb.Bin212]|nr:MAG: hypothetical protein BWY19_00148 [bacterium ADurb.Bin212]
MLSKYGKRPGSEIITVNDKMQSGYSYILTENEGSNFQNGFAPDLSPAEMLELGVFGGKYLTDCLKEFPASWFHKAKLSPGHYDTRVNYFRVRASQPLSVWRKRGWLTPEDPRGWFQWYCRYYLGRRINKVDEWQIERWKGIKRHVSQIAHNCRPFDLSCRPRQRQALLHWAYDSRKM